MGQRQTCFLCINVHWWTINNTGKG